MSLKIVPTVKKHLRKVESKVESYLRIKALKNKYAGRRAFVIGNGPSLTVPDLDRLQGEVTIASNKIFLAFDETAWRPTLYTIVDWVVMENNLERVRALDLPAVFPDYFWEAFGILRNANFVPMRWHGEWDGKQYLNFDPHFSDDPLKGLYHGESVTYYNIQLAHYMGCNPIVLIGVDYSFVLPETRIPDQQFGYILVGGGEQNHFSKDYRPAGERWTMPNLREQRISFEYAKNYLEQRGVQLLNASRKTELDVIPRVSLDSLLGGA